MIFKGLTTETEDANQLAGIYINIAWVHLTLKKNTNPQIVDEVKFYLDKAEEHFDSLIKNGEFAMLIVSIIISKKTTKRPLKYSKTQFSSVKKKTYQTHIIT